MTDKPDTAPRPKRSKRSYTLTALLAVFVLAVLLAILGRLLPGRLSRLMPKSLRPPEDDD
jgi:hypothetical protein